jgi:hypothetical protein
MEELLKDIRVMLTVPWGQLPDKFQDDFLDWCSQAKGESWAGIEESGWMIYDREYIAFLITKFLEESNKDTNGAQT